jgi:hypothetical protein
MERDEEGGKHEANSHLGSGVCIGESGYQQQVESNSEQRSATTTPIRISGRQQQLVDGQEKRDDNGDRGRRRNSNDDNRWITNG